MPLLPRNTTLQEILLIRGRLNIVLRVVLAAYMRDLGQASTPVPNHNRSSSTLDTRHVHQHVELHVRDKGGARVLRIYQGVRG